MAYTFLRVNEYSEGNIFYRQIFETDLFVEKWCEKNNQEMFTYTKKWNGYNVPGKIYEEWIKKINKSSVLSDSENDLYMLLKKAVDYDYIGNYYIYAVCENTNDTEYKTVINHETAHALYFLYPKYRKKINSFIKELPDEFISLANNELIKRGYRREVLRDEIQAFLSSENIQTGVLGTKTLRYKIKNLNGFEKFKNYYDIFISSNLQKHGV